MEWNAKSPSHWDWEQLFLLNTKEIGNPRIQPTDWSGEGDREISVGWFNPSGLSGCSGSELIHTSSSKSSKSASINSLSNEESKTSKFICQGSQEDSSSKKDLPKEESIGASPVFEPSPISGEPLLNLNLGKQLYFEHLCQGSDVQNPSFSVAPIPSLSSGKKCKSTHQSPQPPHCKVEGFSLDLSLAKGYLRKHSVSVIPSPPRFHSLSEFNDKKRSCCRCLSDHNARRRKPHPDAVQLNPSILSTPCGRQQMSLFAYPRAAANLGRQDVCSKKFPQTKDFHMKPGGTNSQVHQPFNGVEDSIGTINQYVRKEFSCAHCLLSSNSWGSYDTKSVSNSNHTGQADAGVSCFIRTLADKWTAN